MNSFGGRGAVAVYLNPAEIVVAEDSAIVTTILGSCVSVTLFAPRTRMGAICHAVLPYGSDKEPGKFANQAIRHMLRFFHEKKISEKELVAKVFGGADMFSPIRATRDTGTIGSQNIQAALATLKQVSISPAVIEVSGQQGRKLLFFSETGDVYVKRIQKDQMLKAEQTMHFCKKYWKSKMPLRNS